MASMKHEETTMAPNVSLASKNTAIRRLLVFFVFSLGALIALLQHSSFQQNEIYGEAMILLQTISKNLNDTAVAVAENLDTTAMQNESSLTNLQFNDSLNISAMDAKTAAKLQGAINRDRFFLPAKEVQSHSNRKSGRVLDRPPLSSLVQNYSVVSTNVSWMLDFAVIGFPKCGTTSMLRHLDRHGLIQMHPKEICALPFARPDKLVEALYKLPEDTTETKYSRGYKCPLETEYYDVAHKYYKDMFPNMRVLIGVRHPLLWFESFYNFRVFINGNRMPHPEKLLGVCGKGAHGVCANRGRFHFHLAQMGKTPLNSTDEKALLGDLRRLNPIKTTVQVFLYEVSQLNDPPFLEHIQSFLHLGSPFEAMKRFNHTLPPHMKRKNVEKLDICKAEYAKIHKHFMELATKASQWIQDYFVHSPDVHFAPGLNEAVDKWRLDPCVERRQKQEKPL